MTSKKQQEREILKAFDQWLNDFADLVFQYSQEHLLAEEKVDTGQLFKTANVTHLPYEKTIVYPAPYAESVHFGRAPGSMPPPQALEKWVRRKLGVPPKDVKSTAWAIAKAIEQRGIQPTPFLTEAIKKAERQMNLKR